MSAPAPIRSATPAPERAAIIAVEHVSKSFTGDGGTVLSVLDDVSVTLHEGEVVALLGKSGSGKSTLLRIIAGLIAPTAGTVRYRGAPLTGANPGVGMVFQSFALMPWLTVQANVELGLRARGIPKAQRRQQALDAIGMIGLDGFESAYPKELSGGMRQRVGFARALVLRPDALLMDEPFSALDVLTAENLRNELMSLWAGHDFPTKAICIVTHNIEEAVLLADRVLILESSPGRIKTEVPVYLPRPRDRRSPAFEVVVDQLYAALTGQDDTGRSAIAPSAPAASPLTHPLPAASVGGLAGLVEIVCAHNGQTDLPDLAGELSFEVDDLLPLTDAAVMLGMLEVEGADLFLTDTGSDWQAADIQASKEIFARLAVANAPLVRTICKALENSNDGSLRDDFFRDLLHRGFSAEDTEKQLGTAIGWGRYGELYDYDADSGELIITEVYSALQKALADPS
jgi:NitT/TauT family transport system ATP-binding protein